MFILKLNIQFFVNSNIYVMIVILFCSSIYESTKTFILLTYYIPLGRHVLVNMLEFILWPMYT